VSAVSVRMVIVVRIMRGSFCVVYACFTGETRDTGISHIRGGIPSGRLVRLGSAR
jgi:hypothetical protein